ncbi:hypothetical protein M8J76_010764 [Diaphorina citri]|nr:hypothetical protein M8J76_010764 [Diaphorina citri]
MTDKYIIIGGDMNSHIGEEHVLEEELVMDTSLLPHRLSRDTKFNRRGEDLLGRMDALGMIVLNGRITGDIPAQLTYVDEKDDEEKKEIAKEEKRRKKKEAEEEEMEREKEEEEKEEEEKEKEEKEKKEEEKKKEEEARKIYSQFLSSFYF